MTVAVVDQEVDATHPDLRGTIEPGRDFIEPTAARRPTPTGFADHGTHVAGTLAAAARQRDRHRRRRAAAHVLPLRALDNCGGGDLDWVLDAFD